MAETHQVDQVMKLGFANLAKKFVNLDVQVNER